jgi:hypothetical protein
MRSISRSHAALLLFLLGMVVAKLLLSVPRVEAQVPNLSLRLYGNGSGDIDRIKIPIDNPERPVDVGNGSFTLEWWMKASTVDNTANGVMCGSEAGWIYGNILLDRDIYGGGDYGDFGVSLTGGRVAFGVTVGSTGTTLCSSTSVANNQWHHVALTRNSTNGQLFIFIDGALNAQSSGPTGNVSYRNNRSTAYPNSDPYFVIGAEKHDAGPGYPSYSGFIDELRVSNSLRYSSNFAVPTTPFVTDSNTVGLYHFDEGNGAAEVIDSSLAPGGPSNGMVKLGGNPAGPVWVQDSPFSSQPQPTSTPVPTLIPTPTLPIDPSPTPSFPTPTPTTGVLPTSTPVPTLIPTPTTVPGGTSSSLQFDGGDLVQGVNIPLSTQFTYEAWVKRTSDNNNYQTFMSDATSSYSQTMVTMYVDGSSSDCSGAQDQFAYYQSAGNLILCSGISANLNTWYHVAVTRDTAGTLRFFVNGSLVATRTNSTAPFNSTGRFNLGRAGDFAGEYFTGRLHEVRVSNTARYFNQFTPQTTPYSTDSSTVVLYHLNNASGQTVTDSSGYARNGVLGTTTSVQASDPVWSSDVAF